jgi:hypothetical protein
MAQSLTAPELTAPELTAPELTAPELTAPELTAPPGRAVLRMGFDDQVRSGALGATEGSRGSMTWSWQLEKQDGTVVTARNLPKETFSSQGDAESWLGENWRSLLEGGVDQVTLLEEDRTEYGPMSLHPAVE